MSLDSQQERSAAQFDRQAGNYGRGHILEDTRDVRELLALISEPKGRALDVATGGGHAGLALAKAGYEVVLGDLAPAMIANAVNLLKEEGFEVESALFPAERFPFPDASFDLVSCRVAPHHFSDVASFVREAFRVLKSGGYFMVIDGSLADGDPETAAWLHQVEKLRDPSHGRLLDRREWTDLATDAGFDVIHAELLPMNQPDLEWYFKAAATPEENRAKVRELIATASPQVRSTMKLIDDDGPIRWTWQRLSMLCKKP
ncbi:methyltransferase domain-containing protein [Luteolibacter pohnpeiensis]|uniref:Methyltransferase domain-containing protein n=1 Tax=Luteolibacter pohnpeiensis TaxID=454153 RepID=A0A934S7T2_9BACT|nr:class I SAM-dependent methyltransferase [Luteolibacter pohnpeiensis]MBK1881277.1 methyltransferase domain-containing protein [Luteolibacter pohnpeiensis]